MTKHGIYYYEPGEGKFLRVIDKFFLLQNSILNKTEEFKP